jgi:hypothetical protein
MHFCFVSFWFFYHLYWGYTNLIRGARINTPPDHKMLVFVLGFFGVVMGAVANREVVLSCWNPMPQ